MKKLFLLLFALTLCSIAIGDTWSVNIDTNSTVIVPKANNLGRFKFSDWVTNATYAAGEYSQVDEIVYWTPNGGTAGTNTTLVTNGWNVAHTTPVTATTFDEIPSVLRGLETTDDGIIWKRVQNSGRTYLIIDADTTIDVLYDIATDATTNSGGRLSAAQPKQVLPGMEDDVRAMTESGTATIRVVEQ